MVPNLIISLERITARELLYRERHVAENEREKIRARLDQQSVEILNGSAAFEDEHTIGISAFDTEPTANLTRHLLVATALRVFPVPDGCSDLITKITIFAFLGCDIDIYLVSIGNENYEFI